MPLIGTETTNFPEINVEIAGYEKFHTASKTSKGGTAISVNKNYVTTERNDHNVNNAEFESTWIEIKTKNSKNICGSIYRHPHYNFDEFFKYLESCPSTIAKENKEVYICGDYNFDLLKIDSDYFTEHFFNLLCSYGLLPLILQPTRVTVRSATIIDNIFSNNIQDDIISANLLLTFSEHFSQFITVTREKNEFKKLNVYLRDYSKFSNESFRDDVSIQISDYTHGNVHDLFKDFYSKLEGAVNRHDPLKKLSPKEIKVKSKPWLSAEILKMIKIRNKVFNRKKRQPTNANCKRLYNLLRNRITLREDIFARRYFREKIFSRI